MYKRQLLLLLLLLLLFLPERHQLCGRSMPPSNLDAVGERLATQLAELEHRGGKRPRRLVLHRRVALRNLVGRRRRRRQEARVDVLVDVRQRRARGGKVRQRERRRATIAS